MAKGKLLLFRCGQLLAVLMGLVLLLATPIGAQEATGDFYGTVSDPQGAAIPDAKVTITNVATQISRDTLTSKDGTFQVLSLPIGTYRVTVEKEGFKKLVSDPKVLHINEAIRLDLKLEVGAVSETIEVTAEAAAVETVHNTLGQSVTSRPIINLPLNGRNVLQLALLVPGVTEKNPDATGQAGDFQVAGGRSDSITFLLDGGVNNNLLNNAVVYNPNPDTIAEFRILTSNYAAEYGRNGAGIVSVVTKSGSNEIHGSVFEFLRNDVLNANTFFRNRDRLPRDVLKRNQFGFTIGGPVLLPKFNGRDRFFFFASYQGQRLSQLQSQPGVTVPTPAELSGDFSRSNSSRTGPDSRVVSFLQSFPFFQPNAALRAQGIIDPSRINSVARAYIQNNLIPTAPPGTLLQPTSGRKDDNDEVTLKFDFLATSKDRLAVTMGARRNPRIEPFSDEANVPGFPVSFRDRRYFTNIAYTRVWSPTFLNEFRFTAQRRNNLQNVPARKLPKATEMGIGIISDNPTGPSQLTFEGGLTLGFSRNGPTDLVDNTFTWSDAVTWVKGRHTLKFGGNYVPYQNNTVFDFFINGRFSFNGTSGGIGSRNAFADFLMGLPDEYLQFPEAPSDIRTKSLYGFAQDEWHVRKNLVLTYGIRYEYSQPKLDTRGRSFSLKLGAKSTRFPNAPAGLLFPGDPGAPRGSNFSDFNDWSPRFGFAWDPKGNGKTSIRGGFGVFYDILKGEDNLQFNGQAPFFGFVDLSFDPLGANPAREVNYLTQPFVATGQPNPFPSKPPPSNLNFDAAGFLPIGGGGVFFVDPHLRTPYIYQYSLSVQREVAKNLIAEAAYAGSSAHKLTTTVDANPFVLGTVHRLFNAQPGNDDFSFSFMEEFRNAVTASYNSLALSLQKRLSETHWFGTTYFTFAYTYGHSIDNSSGFRQRNRMVPFYDHKRFRASSNFDIHHRISFSGGWDLPFNRWWSSGPARLTKGWSVYPIVTWRSGFPLDVLAQFSRRRARPGPSGAGDSNLVRANLVSGTIQTFDPKNPQTFSNRTGNFWFNPTNFTTAGLGGATCTPCATNPAIRTYGTVPRNAFTGPRRTNVDFAIAKVTPLYRERVNLEFRAEFFDLFNTVQFANPSTNITSALFGQITTTGNPNDPNDPGARVIQFAARVTF